MSSETEKGREPNNKEAVFLGCVFRAIKGNPAVDWELAAKLSGLKNAKVANTKFGQLKKSLGIQIGNDSRSAVNSPKKDVAKGDGRVTKGKTETTPTRKRKAAKITKSEESEDDVEKTAFTEAEDRQDCFDTSIKYEGDESP